MLNKVLIANRGEIAVRIMRTCRELGVETVAVYSELDRDALHVRMADEAYALGGQTSAESYLNTDAILAAIDKSGADAVHPGYGFFSENADFARSIVAKGVTFVGPPPEAIEIMGDKISARLAAERAEVAGVPGRSEAVTDSRADPGVRRRVRMAGRRQGRLRRRRPGHEGGRPTRPGPRRRWPRPNERPRPRSAAARSTSSATWSGPGTSRCRCWRTATAPRCWLGERDCSCQRRHQKLIEECPAPDFPDAIRVAMGEAAVKVARACGYTNAGTVEFLYQDGAFYFLEMNTRLQVEHPITELVTGLDLVAWQLKIASGEALTFGQDEVRHHGHAIEVRLNAEDPAGGRFLPSPGTIVRFDAPGGPGVRFDTGYEAGDTVSQHYDNLMAKLSVWGEDREAARRRMLRALEETRIEGVASTIPADVAILSHPDFVEAKHSTRWVEDRLDLSDVSSPAALGEPEPPDSDKVLREVDRRGRRPPLPGEAVGADVGTRSPGPLGIQPLAPACPRAPPRQAGPER